MHTTDSPLATRTDQTTAFPAADRRGTPNATGSSHRAGPDALRELVRLLARQAAAETWAAHLKASSATRTIVTAPLEDVRKTRSNVPPDASEPTSVAPQDARVREIPTNLMAFPSAERTEPLLVLNRASPARRRQKLFALAMAEPAARCFFDLYGDFLMTHATRSGPRAEPHRLQSVAAVAERLGVSTKSVRRMIEQNVLHHHRIGRLIRFTEDDIATFINARRK